MTIFLGAIGCLAVVTIWASQTIPSYYKAYQACQIAKNWEPPKHQGAVGLVALSESDNMIFCWKTRGLMTI